MIDFKGKESYGVKDLAEIVRLLRGENGCPWDKVQTHESIRRNFLEESYEVAEAIDEGSPAHLQEELGDVLLQVVFHARIAEEDGSFTLDDVADGICKKLIYRHPHIFSDVKVADADEVLVNWEALKRIEKSQETYADSVESVARSLPALWRSEKIQKKAKKAGFDWDDIGGAVAKIHEETAEFEEAVRQNTNVEEELGDLLFAAVNAARFAEVDPETALHKACDKFSARFRRVEELAGGKLDTMTLAEMDVLWERAKKDLKA